ncbi:NFACT RNA binding domain-containing protein [Intestinibacillus sp. NTUH-41-i26]|uniref:Rqc2 family fibronectin-binding protein n=1 Tax=Butyricicoccaceae TaxID=3085642 RepID=UPI000D1DF490|nr:MULTISPECIES: NFACT RNA binding domain-containing protein [Butyricicoccaceae]WOC74066.1 NFACT RNA binding domain-containing protein [Intestinibacillus sp. NTUH-41-i26]
MPLDAICLGAVTEELNHVLAGCRVEKVYQPDRDEIVLQTRGQGGARRLLVSTAAGAPRVHFIDVARENPAAPPMFCMLLRKHVQGAKIAAVVQPAVERMLTIELDTTDEMGVACKKHLICELMGKHSNVILCGEDNRIIDAMRRVDGDLSGKRQVLPGLFYRLPPAQEKHDPFALSGVGLSASLQSADGEMGLDRYLLSQLLGFSPLLCRELSYRATGDAAKPVGKLTAEEQLRLAQVFEDLKSYLTEKRWKPFLLTKTEDHAVFDFSFLPITQYEGLMTVSQEQSFSDLLAAFFEKKGKAERMARRSADLHKAVVNARDRLARKLAAQQKELDATQNREQYKRLGDLITANLYQLEKGMNKAVVVDYYDEACPEVEVALDVRLTPQQNAQKYFKLYNKAKTAEEVLTQQLAQGRADLDYLESVLVALGEAESERDLAQLREELTQEGVLSSKQARNKKQRVKPVAAKPFHYRSSDGFDIFAGKNNLQNDLLTLKTAFKSDIWFHTQKIHGSHVILVADGREPTDRAMTEAAMIAAYHSKARQSSLVPVDYTPVRQVKKPAGAKPGMVIYHVYQTAYVTPDEAAVERLRIE